MEVAGIRLDPASHQVERDGAPIDLRPKEFSLLELFLQHPGHTLTRGAILDKVWDLGYEGDSNVIDVTIKNLRERVDRPFGRASIETVRGVGYRLDPER